MQSTYTVSRWYEGFQHLTYRQAAKDGGDTCAIYHSNNLYATGPCGQLQRTIEMYMSEDIIHFYNVTQEI